LAGALDWGSKGHKKTGKSFDKLRINKKGEAIKRFTPQAFLWACGAEPANFFLL